MAVVDPQLVLDTTDAVTRDAEHARVVAVALASTLVSVCLGIYVVARYLLARVVVPSVPPPVSMSDHPMLIAALETVGSRNREWVTQCAQRQHDELTAHEARAERRLEQLDKRVEDLGHVLALIAGAQDELKTAHRGMKELRDSIQTLMGEVEALRRVR